MYVNSLSFIFYSLCFLRIGKYIQDGEHFVLMEKQEKEISTSFLFSLLALTGHLCEMLVCKSLEKYPLSYIVDDSMWKTFWR